MCKAYHFPGRPQSAEERIPQGPVSGGQEGGGSRDRPRVDVASDYRTGLGCPTQLHHTDRRKLRPAGRAGWPWRGTDRARESEGNALKIPGSSPQLWIAGGWGSRVGNDSKRATLGLPQPPLPSPQAPLGLFLCTSSPSTGALGPRTTAHGTMEQRGQGEPSGQAPVSWSGRGPGLS